MKKLCVLLCAATLLLCVVSCGFLNNDAYSSDTHFEKTSEDSYYRDLDSGVALDKVLEEYSITEIIHMYSNYADIEEDLCEHYERPYMPLIFSEIADNGGNMFEYLFTIADKIGYWPSAILGTYCIDRSTNIIHDTDSDCVANMNYSDMSFPVLSKNEIIDEISDGDKYLQDCSFCPICCSGLSID